MVSNFGFHQHDIRSFFIVFLSIIFTFVPLHIFQIKGVR